MTREESIIYLAGYLDADGCFNIPYVDGMYYLKVNAAGTDSEHMSHVAALLVDICGFDAVSWLSYPVKGKGKCKDAHRVVVSQIDAVLLLCSKLLPYLILKKERASILLALGNYKKRNSRGLRDKKYMKSLYDRMRILNKRGEDNFES